MCPPSAFGGKGRETVTWSSSRPRLGASLSPEGDGEKGVAGLLVWVLVLDFCRCWFWVCVFLVFIFKCSLGAEG